GPVLRRLALELLLLAFLANLPDLAQRAVVLLSVLDCRSLPPQALDRVSRSLDLELRELAAHVEQVLFVNRAELRQLLPVVLLERAQQLRAEALHRAPVLL